MRYPDDYINKIINGDCLKIMADIPPKVIDMILCDPPYGRTNIEWDKALDLHRLFEHYRRIIKENGAIVLTGQQPFVTDLITEARDIFRYDIIWQKHAPLGYLNAKKMPLRNHEHILVFYKHLPTYNPQKTKIPNKAGIGRVRKNSGGFAAYQEYRKPEWSWTETGERYPTSILDISNWNGALFGNTEAYIPHPTAKPIELFEYLIKTFTNSGDIVLDNCLGSGTTAIAAKNTGRRYIGIELKREYCELAESRIKEDIHEEKDPQESTTYQSRF